jgi:hypothetical protein
MNMLRGKVDGYKINEYLKQKLELVINEFSTKDDS